MKFLAIIIIFGLIYLFPPLTNAALILNETFDYDDNSMQIPNWKSYGSVFNESTLKMETYNSPIYNENGEEAKWTVINKQYQINLDPQNKLTAIRSIPQLLTNNLSNYELEFDLFMNEGISFDRSIGFRYKDEYNHYIIHTYNNNVTLYKIRNNIGEYSDLINNYASYPFEDNQKYNFKIKLKDNNIKVFIENLEIINSTDIGIPIPQGPIAINAIAYGSGTKMNIDNIKISTLNTTILEVPLIKQTDNKWRDFVYDKGNAWNPIDPTINSWGCALTSAAMVFKYHGINKLPNKSKLNPATLNAWLNRQKDGYIGNGHVNWLALSRLSKQSIKINRIKSFDALEFKKTYTDDKSLIIDDLSKNLPDILEIPGHFVTARGNDENNDILINDPYYDRTLLSEHSGNLISINSFSPSHTDLSYIMLVVNSEIDLEMYNSQGNEIGKSAHQNSIQNPNFPSQNNGQIKILYLPKPATDNYKIKLSSPENETYNLSIYLYDKDGEVFTLKKSGITNRDGSLIDLPYNGQAKLYPKKVTINSLLVDIQKGFIKNNIKDLETKIKLDLFSVKYKTQTDLNKPEQALKTLLEMEDYIYSNSIKINEIASKNLLYDINYLATHL